MGGPAYELIAALVTIAGLTVGYAILISQAGVPQAGGLIGHAMGVVGFLMMLSTETLYSLRKHVKGFTYGPMRTWMQIHVFTGLVGPYLVLLHSGGKFNGLAGWLTLLTAIVVLSGMVGRYIYTAVPRNLEGTELAVAELEEKIAAFDRQLQEKGIDDLAPTVLAALSATPAHGWFLVLGRPWIRWRQKRQLRRVLQGLNEKDRARAAPLERLLAQRQRLQMEIDSLDVTRRLLALWYTFHIPLSAGLFTLALIHIVGAMYYATFMK
jgi:hypothetical protein